MTNVEFIAVCSVKKLRKMPHSYEFSLRGLNLSPRTQNPPFATSRLLDIARHEARVLNSRNGLERNAQRPTFHSMLKAVEIRVGNGGQSHLLDPTPRCIYASGALLFLQFMPPALPTPAPEHNDVIRSGSSLANRLELAPANIPHRNARSELYAAPSWPLDAP